MLIGGTSGASQRARMARDNRMRGKVGFLWLSRRHGLDLDSDDLVHRQAGSQHLQALASTCSFEATRCSESCSC